MPARRVFHWCTSPCSSTARSGSYAAARLAASASATSTARSEQGRPSRSQDASTYAASLAAFSAPVGRPLSGAGRHSRIATRQRISCRCSIGRPIRYIDGPSRSSSIAPDSSSWRSSRTQPSPSASRRTVDLLGGVPAVAAPDQQLEHGRGAVGQRGGGDERLGRVRVRRADRDLPVPFQPARPGPAGRPASRPHRRRGRTPAPYPEPRRPPRHPSHRAGPGNFTTGRPAGRRPGRRRRGAPAGSRPPGRAGRRSRRRAGRGRRPRRSRGGRPAPCRSSRCRTWKFCSKWLRSGTYTNGRRLAVSSMQVVSPPWTSATSQAARCSCRSGR